MITIGQKAVSSAGVRGYARQAAQAGGSFLCVCEDAGGLKVGELAPSGEENDLKECYNPRIKVTKHKQRTILYLYAL